MGVKITKHKESRQSLLTREVSLSPAFGGKSKEVLYRDLAMMLESGISLKESLQLIYDEEKKTNKKVILERILTRIGNGSSIEESMNLEKQFTSYETTSIRMGEESGRIVEVFKRLSEYYKASVEQRRLVVGAMIYPITILVTSIGAVSFLLIYLVPMFEEVFTRGGEELPLMTQALINISDALQFYFPYLLIVVISLIVLHLRYKSNDTYSRIRDRIFKRIPIFGGYLKKSSIMEWSAAMALMMENGLTLSSAIDLSIKLKINPQLTDGLIVVKEQLLKGSSLHAAMQNLDAFNLRMITVVKVAEESNRLGRVFSELSSQYQGELQYQSKLLSSVMEPIIIGFLGLVVGFILLAMYLPIFEMSSGIGY